MLNKIIVTLIGMVITVFAICSVNLSQAQTVENYLMFPRKVERVIDLVDKNTGCSVSTSNNFQGKVGKGGMRQREDGSWTAGQNAMNNLTLGRNQRAAQFSPNFSEYFNSKPNVQFFKPANLEKNVPPRFQSGLRGTMKQNLNNNYMAVSTKSCKNSNEGYCSGVPSCSKGGGNDLMGVPGVEVPSNYAAGNYNQLVDEVMGEGVVDNDLPIGDMTGVDIAGNESNVIAVDRWIYAPLKSSRTQHLGDPIRGDLPIVPCGPAWFRPSGHPATDLKTGAMGVLSGTLNDTALLQMQDNSYVNSNNFGGGIGNVTSQAIMAANNVNLMVSSQQSGAGLSALNSNQGPQLMNAMAF